MYEDLELYGMRYNVAVVSSLLALYDWLCILSTELVLISELDRRFFLLLTLC
jgi:hypothetical protein